MNTYITAHAAHPLGRWLATLAVSLVLLALAYAQAPDPAEQLGFNSPSTHAPTSSHLAPDQQRSHRAPGHTAVLAAAQLRQPTGMAPHTQFAR